MATASYIPQPDCKAAMNQVNLLADFVLKFYPEQIGKGNGKQGETIAEVVIRLLSPTVGVDDTNSKVPVWAVDTLAKKELRRLAQYMMDTFPDRINEGGIVDNIIGLLNTAYANL